MFNVTIELFANDEKDALYDALKPDVSIKDEITIINNVIIISINDEKISDLRARTNSYLRLCKAAISCIGY